MCEDTKRSTSVHVIDMLRYKTEPMGHPATSTSPSRLMGIMWMTLFVLVEFTGSADGTTTQSTDAKAKSDDSSGMLKGMAAGFGGFVAIIVLICVLWCCCCGQDDSNGRCCCKDKDKDKSNQGPPKPRSADRAKVAPSPPQSANSWSRAR
ncbi:unnamed protein product [Lymnaea stagnalis]|uniref:Uncharacterized protein n=1 Tax=Lymnaea stagnalis TaxID=6523 RepID=A0AAV2GYV8_LYMST